MSEEKIVASRDGGVLSLRLNRPAKKNALDRDMYHALLAALAEAAQDDAIRAVLFSGAGGDFTAGNDIADFLGVLKSPADFPALAFVRALAAFEKPLVAAVSGDAVGVGTTMLFHFDLVYAAPETRFRMPFIDLALPPEAAASLLVPRRFGPAKAAQYLMLGEAFGGEEARRLGLVNDLAPVAEVESRALDAARRLAEKPRNALLATRKLLRGDVTEVLARIDEEAALFAKALASEEARARFAAFFARKG